MSKCGNRGVSNRKKCGCTKEGFLCGCTNCECYCCDDRRFSGKIFQVEATEPEEKLCFANRKMKGDDDFSCSCKECGCYVCDDLDFQDNNGQEFAPPADEMLDFYNLNMASCTALCSRPQRRNPNECRAKKIYGSLG